MTVHKQHIQGMMLCFTMSRLEKYMWWGNGGGQNTTNGEGGNGNVKTSRKGSRLSGKTQDKKDCIWCRKQ